MPPPGIIEALDVIEHVGFGLVSRVVCLVRRAFGLQRGEEAFHRRVVPAIARAAHATREALVRQQSLERRTGVLTAPIGVMQHGRGLAPPPHRHHQRIRDQLRGHRGLHGPADDPPGEEVHDRGDVEPPFGGPEIGEVGHPFEVRGGGLKLTIEHIRQDRDWHPRAGIGGYPTSSWPCPQGVRDEKGTGYFSTSFRGLFSSPQHRREPVREVRENSSLPLIFLYESTAGQKAQTPSATNPANARIAVMSAPISFIVVTSFLHEALRIGYICAGVGEGPERELTGI